LAVAVVGLNDSITILRRARRVREPPLTIRDLAVPVLLPIGWFVLLVVGGVGVIARRPFGLYLLAAGSTVVSGFLYRRRPATGSTSARAAVPAT
jgi:hypothetical protein